MPKHRIAEVYAGLRHLLGMSNHLHAPAALPFGQEAAWAHSRSDLGREGKNSVFPEESNLGSSEYSLVTSLTQLPVILLVSHHSSYNRGDKWKLVHHHSYGNQHTDFTND